MPDAVHIGLECKASWCAMLLSGEKIVETRQYDLPREYIGQRIWLLASSGAEGTSSIPDDVPAGFAGISVVGWVQFSKVRIYTNKDEWSADVAFHRVPDDTPYSWIPGETAQIYGWVVGSSRALAAPQPVPEMWRLKRSLFAMSFAPSQISHIYAI